AAFVNGDPNFMIEVPAGLLDGDDAADAIRREAMEESGYAVEKVEYLFDMYASPGTLTEKVSLFVARIDLDVQAGSGGGLEDEGEDIEVLTYGLDEAFGMIASGEITDSKTIILLQWAMLNRDRLLSRA
ncbi:NUDIX hydrolase, partial [Agrobacterium sp. S2]|nr:NUDIX hydrolase [Agrobacterium sp. S2]